MTKYQTIFALAEYTARNVAQSEDNWKHYLRAYETFSVK